MHGRADRRRLSRPEPRDRARRPASRISTGSRLSGIRTLRYPVLWETISPDSPDAGGLRLARRAPGAPARARHPADRRPVPPRQRAALHQHARSGLAGAAGAPRRATWPSAIPHLDLYTPVNEPLTTARFSGLYGHWYPHGTSYEPFLQRLVNECKATVLAMRAIRQGPPGRAARADGRHGQDLLDADARLSGRAREPAPLAHLRSPVRHGRPRSSLVARSSVDHGVARGRSRRSSSRPMRRRTSSASTTISPASAISTSA